MSSSTCEIRMASAPAWPAWESPPNLVPPLVAGAIGWVMRGRRVEAGVPEDVADVLSAALCDAGRVVFLDSSQERTRGEAWTPVSDGFASVLEPPSRGFFRAKEAFPLRCTTVPRSAALLFQDPVFRWDAGTQAALVSDPGAPPPRLTHALLAATLDGRGPAQVLASHQAELTLVMRPGPDGDFACILALDRQSRDRLAAALARRCGEAGLPLRLIDAQAFSETQWVRP